MDYFISPLLFFIFISCIMLYHALYSLMIAVLGLLDLPLVFVLWKYVLIFLSYIFVGPKPSDLYGKHTWKIEKFSQLTKRELRSNAFEVGGYKWYVDGYIFEINSVPSNIFNIFWSPCLQVSCIFPWNSKPISSHLSAYIMSFILSGIIFYSGDDILIFTFLVGVIDEKVLTSRFFIFFLLLLFSSRCSFLPRDNGWDRSISIFKIAYAFFFLVSCFLQNRLEPFCTVYNSSGE